MAKLILEVEWDEQMFGEDYVTVKDCILAPGITLREIPQKKEAFPLLSFLVKKVTAKKDE